MVNVHICLGNTGHIVALLFLLAATLVLSGPCMAQDTPTIANVSVMPKFFQPGDNESAEIAYKLNQDAIIAIKIFDDRDTPVLTLVDSETRAAGHHRELWDGRDADGQLFPGIYRFTIEAGDGTGEAVVSDLTDITGGRRNPVVTKKVDTIHGRISYVLKSPALVITRIGLADGGPFLRALEYREPKPAGLNHVPWDGMDNAGVVNFLKHPKLKVYVDAYGLNANSIVVMGREPGKSFRTASAGKNGKVRSRKRASRRVIRNHWQHEPGTCRDPQVKIAFPGAKKRDDGTLEVKGPVRIKVDVPKADRALMIDERFEVMIFVDYNFVFEDETAFFPYNWTWDPKGDSGKTRNITVNIIGYEGHIGSNTVKVRLKP